MLFGKKDPEDFEAANKVLRDRMQAYDVQAIKISKLEEKLDNILGLIEYHQKMHEIQTAASKLINDNMKNHSSEINKLDMVYSREINKLYDKFNWIDKHQNHLFESLNADLDKKINLVHQDIEKCAQHICMKDALETQDGKIAGLENNQKVHADKLNKVIIQQVNTDDQLRSHKAHLDSNGVILNEMRLSHKRFDISDADIKHDFEKKLQGNKDQIKADLDNQMQSYIQSQSGASLEAVKQEILKKMELMALDSQNAVLLAKNAAKQIELMERKIENLFHSIKKIELA